jgi:hypothetical protein
MHECKLLSALELACFLGVCEVGWSEWRMACCEAPACVLSSACMSERWAAWCLHIACMLASPCVLAFACLCLPARLPAPPLEMMHNLVKGRSSQAARPAPTHPSAPAVLRITSCLAPAPAHSLRRSAVARACTCCQRARPPLAPLRRLPACTGDPASPCVGGHAPRLRWWRCLLRSRPAKPPVVLPSQGL